MDSQIARLFGQPRASNCQNRQIVFSASPLFRWPKGKTNERGKTKLYGSQRALIIDKSLPNLAVSEIISPSITNSAPLISERGFKPDLASFARNRFRRTLLGNRHLATASLADAATEVLETCFLELSGYPELSGSLDQHISH
jgi:hypothetical protein